MYGLVNQAVQDVVTLCAGEAAWTRVRREAGVTDEVFVSTRPYPDELTGALVSIAARVLGLSSSEFLVKLGEHWVLETAVKHYGPLMRAGGDNLETFLEHLPHFHARIGLMLPELRPPGFRISARVARGMRLHYSSGREGLEPFVRGLLRGLATHFQVDITVIEGPPDPDSPGERAVFELSW